MSKVLEVEVTPQAAGTDREGRQEGMIAGMRDVLLRQLTLRFGRLPAKVRRQVEETSSLQELRRLGRRILRAQSLQEMGLG